MVIVFILMITGLAGYIGIKNWEREFLSDFFCGPETRKRRQEERKIERDIKYYEESYANMLELLKDTWYLRGTKMLHGGIIQAVNKKYPNVRLQINLYYNPGAPQIETSLRPELYIDETHSSTFLYGIALMMSDNESKRKESLKNFNKLIEIGIKQYCEGNKLTMKEGNFYFSFTDKEQKWHLGWLPIKDMSEREIYGFQYTYTTTEKKYFDQDKQMIGAFDVTTTQTTNIKFDDTQKAMLSFCLLNNNN